MQKKENTNMDKKKHKANVGGSGYGLDRLSSLCLGFEDGEGSLEGHV